MVDQELERAELRKQMDAEVKRVSDLFRFVLKFKRHFQPSGVEFSGLRQYLPSDDASRIDWKISAGKPDLYVKQYDEEIDMDVFIIVDVSESMLFGTAEKLKSEYAAIVSAALAYASIDAGIHVGIGIFGEEEMVITPQGGTDQYQLILERLTQQENYGGEFNLEAALNSAIGQIKDDTAIFIVSDFINVQGDWKGKMQLSSNKFRHVMSIMTRDLRDVELPRAGNIRFESPHTGNSMVVHTDHIRDDFNEEALKQQERMEEKISAGGSSFLKIDTREKFSAAFAKFFDEDRGEW